MHNCSYCYARSLLDFRGLWNAENPRVADIQKIRRKLEKVPPGTILRLGGMTDCFQPVERQEQVTYQTIEQLNEYGIGYLIVTKSHLAGEERYRKLYDPKLAHIQITITCFDDKKALGYENASSPSKRLRALLKLQEEGFDVTLRLSPLIEEYLDFDYLNRLPVNKVLVEFLRVNGWMKKWFPDLDYQNYVFASEWILAFTVGRKNQDIGKNSSSVNGL